MVGLDSIEHGLASAYSGFSIMDVSGTMTMDVNENTSLGVSNYEEASEAARATAVKVVLRYDVVIKSSIKNTGMKQNVSVCVFGKYETVSCFTVMYRICSFIVVKMKSIKTTTVITIISVSEILQSSYFP